MVSLLSREAGKQSPDCVRLEESIWVFVSPPSPPAMESIALWPVPQHRAIERSPGEKQ